MSTLLTVLLIALGAGLIASGLVAVARRRASASSEGADERVFEGTTAVLLGGVWILLGLLLVLTAALPDSYTARTIQTLLR